MRAYLLIGVILWVTLFEAKAQTGYKDFYFVPSHAKGKVLPCKIVNNLILVPATLNGSDTLWFILDSGVQTTLLTEWPEEDSIPVRISQQVQITGLGEGQSITAHHSWGNTIVLDGVQGDNQDVLVITDNSLSLSQSLGMPVHGIIGYPFFNSFDIEVNYHRQLLRLHPPGTWQPSGKFYRLPMALHRSKPFVEVPVSLSPDSSYSFPFLVDLGASHALSLYTFAHPSIQLPKPALPAFLGKGLSGNVQGHIARIDAITIGHTILERPVVSFPDSNSIQRSGNDTFFYAGSLGGEIFRRFRTVISYRQEALFLRPSRATKEPFRHNTTGIEIITPLPGYPVYLVDIVNRNSPAALSGVRPGDQILYVNGVNTATMNLQETINALNGPVGRRLRLYIIRNGKYHKCVLHLRDDI